MTLSPFRFNYYVLEDIIYIEDINIQIKILIDFFLEGILKILRDILVSLCNTDEIINNKFFYFFLIQSLT